MPRSRLAALLVLLIAGALAGCVIGTDTKPLPPVGQASVDAAKTRCERSGGRWAGRPGRGMLCFHTPPDAGKTCSRASDCTSGCLAKSRSCAPVVPLLGCQDLIDDQGRVVTQCVN